MLAVLLLPFALHAQNTLTVANGTNTNSYVPVYGLYVDDYVRCQTVYPANEIASSALAYSMTGGTITSLTYYLSTPATASWGDAQFVVNLLEVPYTTLSSFVDMTDATTVYTGSLDATQSTMEITFTTPYTYQGGNLLIEIYSTAVGSYKSAYFYGINASGASWQGYNSTSWTNITGSVKDFIPKTTFTFTGGSEITCVPVTALNVDNSETTSSSLTITWTDTLNTDATYTVYNMDDNTVLQSGITDHTYTITGLEANTAYSFGVEANCSASDVSSIMTVSGRTACSLLSTLPFTEDFEDYPSGDYQMPFCWSRYISASTASATYPYSYSGNSHSGSRSLYFYGTTGDAYPDTMVAIMPELDVTLYPMNANRLVFWAKMGTSSNSKNVYVGTLTDPTDPSTFTLVDSVLVSGSVYTKFSIPMADATGAYVAMVVFKGTGSMYIDDVTLEEMPSCLEVSNLTVSGTTSNSITLSWVDSTNTDATYTIYDMSDNSLIGTSNTHTYTAENLDANTVYTFGVQANCSAGDAPLTTVSGRTACTAFAAPFTWTFEDMATSATPECWTKVGSGTVAVQSGTSNSHESSRYLRFNGSTSNLVVLPETENEINTLQLRFWTRPESFTNANCGNFSVGYVTDASDASSFVEVSNYVYSDFSAYDEKTVIFLNAPAGARLAMRHNAGSTSWYWYVDDVTIEDLPSCPPVSGMAIDNITANSVTLSWNGTASSYSIYDMSDNTLLTSGISQTTYTVTGLTANTSYVFGVQANCSETDFSSIETIGGRTACDLVTTLPFTEDFETVPAGSYQMPYCWYRYSSAATSAATYPYSYSTTSYSHGGSRVLYFYGTTSSSYSDTMAAILPELDVTVHPMNTTRITFWARMGAATNAKFVYVGTMTDPADPTTLTVIDSVLINGATHTKYIVPLTDANATASYAALVVYKGTGSIYIDDLTLEEIPSCPDVTGLTLVSNTATTATISWDATTAQDYEVEVRQNNVALTDVTITVTENTAEIDGLSVDNDYQIFVRAICGTVSGSWSDALDLHIGYCLPNPTSRDGQGMTSVSFGGMTNTTHPTAAGFGDYTSMVGTVPVGTVATVDITYATGYSYGTIIWVDWNNSLSFEGNEVVYVGESSSTNPTTLTATFNIPATTELGSYRMRIIGADSYYDSYTGSIEAAADADPCATYTWGVAEDYTLTVGEAPDCMPVTGLTDLNTTANSITLSWSGNAASYSIYDMSDTTLIISGITDTTYTIEGLNATSSYTFGVVANCSPTLSSEMVTATFTTSCGVVAIPFVESFESTSTTLGCWSLYNIATNTGLTSTNPYNGSLAFVFAYNTNPPQYLFSPELSGTENGLKVSFMYRIMSTNYPESFQIGYSTTTNDLEAYTWGVEQANLLNTSYQEYSEVLPAGTKFVSIKYTANDMYYLFIDDVTFDYPPTCAPAANLTASAVSENSITISWTGDAASYDVYNGSTFVANVTSNSYTFTGLSSSTSYTFGVQAICSATDTASMVTINTMTECGDITTLPYSEGFEAGIGCWTTVNGSNDGQPWSITDCAGLENVNPHGGNYVASSWSWSSAAMHANAWLISPKFVLPNSAEELTFTWWDVTNSGWPDSYSVVLSTTTADTAAFTTVVYPYTAATGAWTQHSIDLSSYAGQSVYLAFHHVDYDANYLLIDDIELSQGGFTPPTPDTLTVTFAVNSAAMGTTIPAPGTYQYFDGDTVFFSATPNTGYQFIGWEWVTGSIVDTLDANYISAYFPASSMMSYGSMTLTALFEAGNPDSTTVTYAVNDATMGTTSPAPGTYTVYVGNNIVATAIPNDGYELSAWMFDTYVGTTLINSDTILSSDSGFGNPMTFGTLPQSYADYGATITITAVFEASSTPVTQYTVTLNSADTAMGSVSPAGVTTVDEGSSFTATATANTGYHFVAWMSGNTQVSTANPYTFTVNENVTLTATFEADPTPQYTVTLVTADAAMGSVSPAGATTVDEGTTFTATATANPDHHFVAWMNGNTQVSTANPYTFTVTDDITLTATFAYNDGIENFDLSKVNVYSTNSTIVVRGAENQDLAVYDMNGRCIYKLVNANEIEEITVVSAGVYLVRVSNGITKKVVVLK